jgi:ketosteroid isomerase-like protein
LEVWVVTDNPLDPADQDARAQDEIRAVLAAQQRAWCAGDLDTLIDTYLPSDDVRYAGSDGVIRGIAEIRRRFAAAYPDQTQLGQLEFFEIDINVLTARDALVLGQWTLRRESADGTQVLGGLSTLHLRKTAQGWLVLSDHTSTLV